MNEVVFENILFYGAAGLVFILSLFFYLRRYKKLTHQTNLKIDKAKNSGLFEPVSLHPVVNHDICIGSGACIEACPEKDILGLVHGKAVTINASRCVGHGACFHACPVQAITLCIGTEKRGVELPHVSSEFETNIPNIFIAGELGGMGLIKNAIEQGKQAVDFLSKKIKRNIAQFDVAIIGAGPSGISATLSAVKNNLKYITFEQDTIGGTVYSFPRAKVVMTSPLVLPIYGKVNFKETSKDELLNLWNKILSDNNIQINENEKVVAVEKKDKIFLITTTKGNYTSEAIVICIGRRGSPRKLGVKGEDKPKVYYKLLDPELIHNQNILVVGGGDSAIESALLLAEENNDVTISYRSESFSRLKEKNLQRINEAVDKNQIKVILNSTVYEIKDDSVILALTNSKETIEIQNDLVYVFAGGELPTEFLKKMGIVITKKFGDAILKH